MNVTQNIKEEAANLLQMVAALCKESGAFAELAPFQQFDIAASFLKSAHLNHVAACLEIISENTERDA